MTKTDIFNHTDYRSFLLAHHEDKRKKQAAWTLGRWANQLGLSSTSVLTNILKGKRNPGEKIAGNFINYFRFTEKEREYFLDLIELHKFSNKPRLTQLLIEKLGQSHPNGQFTVLNEQQFRLISHPYYYAIRELVNIKSFKEDADWISKHLNLKVSKTQIQKAIADLLDLGLLKRDQKNKLIYANGSISSTHDIHNEALRRFHEEILELAKLSIRDVPLLERDIAGTSLAIDSNRLAECKEYISDFRIRFMNKFETHEQSDQVIHLETALIPLSKKIKILEDKNEK